MHGYVAVMLVGPVFGGGEKELLGGIGLGKREGSTRHSFVSVERGGRGIWRYRGVAGRERNKGGGGRV